MAKKIKAKAVSAVTTRLTILTLEAIYFLTVYNLSPVAMWVKETVA